MRLAGPRQADEEPRRIGPGRYLLPQGIFDLTTRQLTPVPHLDLSKFEYGSLWLLDQATVEVEYKSTHDVLRASRGGGPFVPLMEPIPPKAGDFAFLPDGRHAFKTAPLIGGPESQCFVNVVAGQKVTLHYVSALGGKPKPLVTRDQILHGDFVLGGASIVSWAPRRLDVPKSLRTLLLERVDVATGTVRRLEELTTPFTMRGTPETAHHTPSRFVVHTAYDAEGAESVRIVDVDSGQTKDVPLGPRRRSRVRSTQRTRAPGRGGIAATTTCSSSSRRGRTASSCGCSLSRASPPGRDHPALPERERHRLGPRLGPRDSPTR